MKKKFIATGIAAILLLACFPPKALAAITGSGTPPLRPAFRSAGLTGLNLTAKAAEKSGKSCTYYVGLAEQPRKAQSGRVGAWDEIVVVGDRLFTGNTLRALALIRQATPETYAFVLRYIGKIQQGSMSGMWVRSAPPTFVVGHATYTASVTWYASAIVHDAVHSWQFHTHYAHYGPFVPRDVYFGDNAEAEALEIQIEWLIEIGAPQHEIDWAISLIGTVWWDGMMGRW